MVAFGAGDAGALPLEGSLVTLPPALTRVIDLVTGPRLHWPPELDMGVLGRFSCFAIKKGSYRPPHSPLLPYSYQERQMTS